MLLRPDGDAVICIGQASHAWLSGQLARAWAEVEPREEVCLAAEQHDVGMAQWDLAPALNPETGRPQSFMEMALDVHLGLWSAAPQRLFTQSRYAAALVSMHGTALYEMRDLEKMSVEDADKVRTYLAGQRALQRELAEQVGVTQGTINRIERGVHRPRLGTVRKLAEVLGVDPDELIVWEADEWAGDGRPGAADEEG